MNFKTAIILIIGAGLWACSSVNTISVNSQLVELNSGSGSSRSIDSLIRPYKDSLSKQMDEVIGHSDFNFTVSRPGSNLTNWVADAIFVNQTKTVKLSQPIMCLLNTGGIRSTLNVGDITIGDIYKLMPFDNEIVWVELPVSVLPEIEEYLKRSGGEPISNAHLTNGKLQLDSWRENSTHFWVITSDYLLNGGDKMNFFLKKTNVNQTGKLMRDALIDEVKEQKILNQDTVIRIQL